MAPLRVLMMGGYRCGKTSALASLFDQTIHGSIKEHFTISDTTKVQERDGERIESLCNKRLEIINYIERGEHNTFLADQASTQNFWDYKLKVQVPETNRKMEIIFRDSPGSFFDSEGQHHYAEIVNYLRDCDVFIVFVDTPYMMEGTTAEKKAANVTDSINSLLTQIDTTKAKQVIFVPVKCEKWVKEGKIDEVTEAVEKLYSTTITALKAIDNIEISIIPVETAGDIIFEELREPYLLNDMRNRCCKITDKVVALSNGKLHRLTDNKQLFDDPNAIYPGTNITRRNAWYRLRHEPKAQYTPHNCEQILLHILKFISKRVIKEIKFGGPIDILFHHMLVEKLHTASDILDTIHDNKLIKENCEGIKILKPLQ